MDGATDILIRAPVAAKQRRAVVINLETRWDFPVLCRRSALDLYRDRERLDGKRPPHGLDPAQRANPGSNGGAVERTAEVDFWDVRKDTESESLAQAEKSEARSEELDAVWRYWPRPIRGGAAGAVAELEEKLAAEFADHGREPERLTVIVLGGSADAAAAGGAPGRVHEFLTGLKAYFAGQPRMRGKVSVALLLTDKDETGAIGKPLSLYRDGTDPTPLPDAVLQLSTSESAAHDRSGSLFLCARVVVDLLRDEQFARSFLDHARDSGPLALRIDSRFRLTAAEYAGLVIRLLRRTHEESQMQTANPRLGEIDPFIQAIETIIFGEDPQGTRKRARAQRTDGSYAIVNEVTKDFDKSIFPAAERARMSIRERFEALAGTADKKRKWPSWLRGHRWSRLPSLETWLEDAFIRFLKDVQKALHDKLTGQNSLLATHENAGVEERRKQAGRMASKLHLGLFGTGERAKDNSEKSINAIREELDAIAKEIAEFWDHFVDEPKNGDGNELLTKGEALVRDHCPLMRRESPEARELIAQFDKTRKSFNDLMSRPSPCRWLAGCAALLLLLPALWTVLWAQGFPTQPAIPALNILIWVIMFMGMLRGPWWFLARGHREVEKLLADLDEAALALLRNIEQRLADVAAYVGIIQRHNFLRALEDRIRSLASEASLIDAYLNNVEESFGSDAKELANRPGTDDGDVSNLVNRLRGLRECREWLDVALRSIALHGAVELRAMLSGGADIAVRTRFLAQPVVVRIEPLASPAEAS